MTEGEGMKQPFDFRLMSESDVSEIHLASIKILSEIGARVPHREYLEAFQKLGAIVDWDTSIVRFPERVIDEVISIQKQNNTAYYRDHEKNDPEDFRQTFFMSGGNNTHIVDPVTQSRRPGNVTDILRAIALGNSLELVERVSGFVIPSEYPPEFADLIQFYLLSVFSEKRYFFTYIYSAESARGLIEMAQTVASDPFEVMSGRLVEYELEPRRNLEFSGDDLSIAAEFTRRGIKTATTYWSWMGRNAPLDYASMLAVTNANILAGLAAIIAMNPENMFFRYIFPPHMVNPANPEMPLMADPNQVVFSWATRQLADFYGFPFTITNSGFSDAVEDNFQAGFEVGITAALAVAAGVNSNGIKGMVGVDQGVSLDRLLTDHEMYRYTNYIFSRTIPVGAETLRLDEVRRAGIGGDFLHSLDDKNRVGEFIFSSPVRFTGTFDEWSRGPKGSQRVRDEVERLVTAGMPSQPVIDDDAIARLDEIFARYVGDATVLTHLKRTIADVTGVVL